MLVRDIMSSNVEFVTNENTLQEAAEKMKDLDIGDLPIVVGDEAVGIITDRDIVIRGVAHGLDPRAATVVDAMTEGIIACREDDQVETVARTMSARKVRRIPVMDTNGKMSGVVSLGDIALNMDKSMVGEVLMEISK